MGIYLQHGYNPPKGGLIPDGLNVDVMDLMARIYFRCLSGLLVFSKGRKAVEEEPAAYQLVGRVMAYQGNDG